MVDKKKGAVKKQHQLSTASNASIHSRSQLIAKSGSRLQSQSRHRLSKQISGNEGDEWLQAKDPVKPPNQLDLPDEALNEEITRILRADNPNAPHNIVRFSYKDGAYKQMASVDQCAYHYVLNGTLIHKESDEAKRQVARSRFKSKSSKADVSQGDEGNTAEAGTSTADAQTGDNEAEKKEGDGDGEGDGDDGDGDENQEEEEEEEEEDEEDEDDAGDGEPDKPLRNQFNFSERAAQCFAPAHRDRDTMTEAPQRETFTANATQWVIFDAYVADQEKQQAAKTKRRSSGTKPEHKVSHALTRELGDDGGSDWMNAAKLIALSTAKKMERLVNQNTFHDVAMDFKYWNDPSDQFKEKQGSLLPLWRFTNEKTKRKHVTCVRWCPEYPDLVLVGYGSYDYTKQTDGAICAYSLKNPSYPEYIIPVNSGVMCIDVHPKQSSLVAAGMYDGSVAVYDLSRKANRDEPLVRSTAKTGKHTDPVWSVEWHEDDVDQNRNFSSVSSDGRVSTWTMVQTELQHTDIIRLSYDTTKKQPAQGAEPLFGLGAGTCLDFNQHRENVFLIGTEEGDVHQCSRAYTSKFLKTFKAHTMAVYTVTWNPFHPRIFASCSADWTLKIWDDADDSPVFTFDLGNAVGCVAWSPFSPTVFAAVTTDGKIHVFDLQQNKYEPICQQQVTKKAKLTQVAFNKKDPIIIVGDDRGASSTFKLSPNLRKALMDKKKKTAEELLEAFDRILESVKETPHTQAPAKTPAAK
ncbi:dynein [Salpingoeca rosetta]|uniref:Dynein n=1 Tax=Salpingoeca rosetta (strain ATCC 50818 / BSB-021) TaxID=946362 RepID=F2UPH9_SALR5|nr:dynein [Salpingoeca rosetta]EGD79534.1 dynein [Salpingoeca rosetta]|eukprot:XP_004989015.1 dynein [Salpingoeca rosetta]